MERWEGGIRRLKAKECDYVRITSVLFQCLLTSIPYSSIQTYMRQISHFSPSGFWFGPREVQKVTSCLQFQMSQRILRVGLPVLSGKSQKLHSTFSAAALVEKLITIFCVFSLLPRSYLPMILCVTPPNFTEKTFTNSHKTLKFAKVFSFESSLLYSMFHYHISQASPNPVFGLLRKGLGIRQERIRTGN